jgi:dienelactone hydrolase
LGLELRLKNLVLSFAAILLTASCSEQATATLEQIVESPSQEDMIMAVRQSARQSVALTSLEAIDAELRPHDIIYMPEGEGPFPAVMLFHGCSGRTLSHEQDWARRFNGEGVAVITVDSYSGRGINWEEACNMQVMLPWQRASDVISTIEYAKTLDKIKSDELYVEGFSHGAMTIWASLVFASNESAPIGLETWPAGGINGLKGAFMFYGPCIEPWDLDVKAAMLLAEEDQYIDENTCTAYKEKYPELAKDLSVDIYAGATHTYDHAKPNASNVAAGSRYDAVATEASWQRIQSIMK